MTKGTLEWRCKDTGGNTEPGTLRGKDGLPQLQRQQLPLALQKLSRPQNKA